MRYLLSQRENRAKNRDFHRRLSRVRVPFSPIKEHEEERKQTGKEGKIQGGKYRGGNERMRS